MYLSVISKVEDDIITRFIGNIKNNLSKKQKVVIDTTNYIFNKHVEYSDHCSKVNDVVFIKTHKVGRKNNNIHPIISDFHRLAAAQHKTFS